MARRKCLIMRSQFERPYRQEQAVWTTQFVTRKRVGRDQQLIRAVTAAKQRPGFQTSRSLIVESHPGGRSTVAFRLFQRIDFYKFKHRPLDAQTPQLPPALALAR